MTSTTKKVSEGTFWLSLSSVFMKGIGIAYILLVLSNLTVAEYGLLELALSIPALLGILSLAGLSPVVIADLVRAKTKEHIDEVRDIFSAYFSLRILLALFAGTSLYLATFLLGPHFDEFVIFMVQLLCITLILSPLRSIVTISLNVMHEFKALAFFSFSEEVLKLFLVFIFLVFFGYGVVGVVLAYIITDVFVAVFFSFSILKMRKSFFGGTLFSKNLLHPLSALNGHAKWSVFQSGTHLFGQNIRPWIIQFFLGVHAVGVYAVAFGMYQHVTSLFPLSKVIAPVVPGFVGDRRKLVGFINAAIKYDVIIQVLIGLVSLFFIPFLIYLFFPTYAIAYYLLVVLLFGMIPNSFSRIYESVFQALRLQRNLFSANLVKLFATVMIAPVMLWLFGLYGIAIEFFITSALYSFGRYRVLKREVPEYNFSLTSLTRVTELDRIILQKVRIKIVHLLKLSK